jgi:hypothetical protein
MQNEDGRLKKWRSEDYKAGLENLEKRSEMLHEQCWNDEATKLQSKVAKHDNNAAKYKYKAIKQCDKTR